MRQTAHIRHLLAAVAFVGLASSALAGPILPTLEEYFVSEPRAGGTLPLPATVSKARSDFVDLLDPDPTKKEEEGFTDAPYAPISDGFGGLKPTKLTGPIDVFGVTGGLSLTPSNPLREYFIDASPSVDTGRFNTTACTSPTPADEDSCERWFDAADNFQILFGGNFSGFGFYATDVGDFGGSLQLQLIRPDDSLLDLTLRTFVDQRADGGALFYGFLDTANVYKGVNVLIGQTGGDASNPDYFGFDDLVLGMAKDDGGGTPMPEPGSLALVGLSLLGLAATRRRRG